MPVKVRPPALEFPLTKTDLATGKVKTTTIRSSYHGNFQGTLDLSERKLGNAGVKALVEALLKRLDSPDVPPLPARNMDLFANFIGVTGAEWLASAMSKGALPALQIVSLHSNKLGDEGVEKLAPALRALKTLKALTLASNEISDTGVAHLVVDLNAQKKELSALKSLSLSYNKVSNEGCKMIVEALIGDASLHSLELVDLEANKASGSRPEGEPTKRALAEVLTTLRLKGEAEHEFGALRLRGAEVALRTTLRAKELDDSGDDTNELVHRLVRDYIEKEKAVAKKKAARAEMALGEHPSLMWAENEALGWW